jgi:hypothetical protein
MGAVHVVLSEALAQAVERVWEAELDRKATVVASRFGRALNKVMKRHVPAGPWTESTPALESRLRGRGRPAKPEAAKANNRLRAAGVARKADRTELLTIIGVVVPSRP